MLTQAHDKDKAQAREGSLRKEEPSGHRLGDVVLTKSGTRSLSILPTKSTMTPAVTDRKGRTCSTWSASSAILAIHVAGIIGIIVHEGLESLGIKMPLFLPCLAAGILLTNLLPRALPSDLWPARTAALALIAEVSLGVFLAMSLMSTKLWILADLTGPLSALLALQLVLAVLFAAVCFRVLGRDYDAAVVSAGFIGFGLGATPTAMAP